jgi:hypothetical protein
MHRAALARVPLFQDKQSHRSILDACLGASYSDGSWPLSNPPQTIGVSVCGRETNPLQTASSWSTRTHARTTLCPIGTSRWRLRCFWTPLQCLVPCRTWPRRASCARLPAYDSPNEQPPLGPPMHDDSLINGVVKLDKASDEEKAHVTRCRAGVQTHWWVYCNNRCAMLEDSSHILTSQSLAAC